MWRGDERLSSHSSPDPVFNCGESYACLFSNLRHRKLFTADIVQPGCPLRSNPEDVQLGLQGGNSLPLSLMYLISRKFPQRRELERVHPEQIVTRLQQLCCPPATERGAVPVEPLGKRAFCPANITLTCRTTRYQIDPSHFSPRPKFFTRRSIKDGNSEIQQILCEVPCNGEGPCVIIIPLGALHQKRILWGAAPRRAPYHVTACFVSAITDGREALLPLYRQVT